MASQNILMSETHQLGPSNFLLLEVKAHHLHLNSAGVSQLHGPTTGNRVPVFQLYAVKQSTPLYWRASFLCHRLAMSLECKEENKFQAIIQLACSHSIAR